MKCLDKYLETSEEVSETTAMDKFRKCFKSMTYAFADALLGVFEAFVFKSKTSHRRDSKRPSRSRPSHMLRLGLGFFILLSTTVYGASITSKMISAKEVKGWVPSLDAAKKQADRVSVCTHSVLEESMTELHKDDKILPEYSDTWEEVLEDLHHGSCDALLLDEEAWNTFRSRGELCDFYKEPTAEFTCLPELSYPSELTELSKPSDLLPLRLHSS